MPGEDILQVASKYIFSLKKASLVNNLSLPKPLTDGYPYS